MLKKPDEGQMNKHNRLIDWFLSKNSKTKRLRDKGCLGIKGAKSPL